MKRRIFSLLLVFCLVLSLLPSAALAADPDEPAAPTDPAATETPEEPIPPDPTEPAEPTPSPTSGQCGENTFWSRDENDVLTFSGQGEVSWINFDAEHAAAIVFEEGVTGIAMGLFGNLHVPTIVIPSSLTSIGEHNFAYSPGVEAYEVAEDNPAFAAVDGILFSKDEKMLIRFPAARSDVQYAVPSTVTAIDSYAFSQSKLKTVMLPSGLTEIRSGTFYDCENLVEMAIPYGVEKIGENAFSRCSSLRSIDLPASVIYIDQNAFGDCSSLTSITIPDGITLIRFSAFDNCSSLSEIVLPDSVTAIEVGAFSGCSNLTTITIPDSVTSFGNAVFRNCTKLHDVYYAGTIEQWNTITGDSEGNERLNYAAIHCADGTIEPASEPTDEPTPPPDPTDEPTSDPSIVASGQCGNDVYWYKHEYGTLRITGTGEMTSSPGWMDTDVTCIMVGDGVTSIADEAFCFYENLRSVSIPETVTVIGERAFDGCPNIQNVNYSGTTEQWNAMRLGSGNDALTAACIYCSDGDINVPVATGELVLCSEAPEGAVTQVRSYYGTRVGVAEMLYDLFNGSITGYRELFTDLEGLSQRQIDAIHWTYWRNILTGFDPAQFLPSSSFNRSELATVFYRVADGENADLSGLSNPYLDLSEYEWCYRPVLWSSTQDWLTFWSDDPAYFRQYDSVRKLTATVYADPADGHVLGVASIRVDDPADPSLPEPCGSNAFWTLADGVLTITGTGEITSSPWVYEHQNDVQRVVISEGITSIVYNAFNSCPNLTRVELPASLARIESCAFSGCGALAEVSFAGTIAQWSAVEIQFGNEPLDRAKILCADGTYYPNGACGEHLTWALLEDGALVISGTGEMTSNPWMRFADRVKTVVLSEGVTSIADQAFCWDGNLTSVSIPASLERIGDSAFYGCASLQSFEVAADSEVFAAVDGVLFDKACTTLVQYPLGRGETYTVPDGVTSIGSGAFRSCEALTALTLPASLERVEYNAFPNCRGLGDVYYPGTTAQWNAVEIAEFNNSLTSAFIHCQDGVVLPSGQCGDNAYWTMDENGVVTVTGTGATWDRYTDGETPDDKSPLSFDSRIRAVVIEPGITRIGGTTFYGCENLEQVSIPDTVTEIGYFAFDGCTSLKRIDLSEHIVRLGEMAFAYSGLTSVTIPASVETMDGSVFAFCPNLTTVVLQPGVSSIGYGAFSECANLTSVTLPTSLERIGDSAFARCTGLTALTIPDGVVEIGDYAFHQCGNLTSVDIPSSVRNIGSHALDNTPIYDDTANWIDDSFYYDSILMRAADNGSVCFDVRPGTRLIAGEAFYNQYNLEQVTIPEGVIAIGRNAFSSCWSLKSIALPESLEYIGSYALGHSGLERVTIPAGVTFIGDGAFQNCSSLTTINVAPGNACFVSVDNVLFTRDMTELILYPSAKSGAYEIPSGVLRIRANAFSGCRNLKRISIPAGVAEIGFSAFSSCGITSLTIPEGVTALPAEMCMACSNLASVTIPASVASIDNSMFGCFDMCDALQDIYYVGTEEQWNAIPGAYRFNNATVHFLADEPFDPIVSQPKDVSGAAGETVLLSVVTQGAGLTYQWQYRQPGKTTWYDSGMPGADGAVIGVTLTQKRDGQSYRCVISDALGRSVTTDPVTVTIDSSIRPTEILSQPTDQTAALGADAVFTVQASGKGLTYQWQYCQSGKTMWYDSSAAGATTDTLTIQATAKRDGQRYRCVVTDVSGNRVISEAAALTVGAPQPMAEILSQPADQTAALGTSAVFTVQVSGDDLTYQWQYCQPGKTMWYDSSAAGADTDTLTIQATAKRDGQRYRCVITDASGAKVISEAALLSVG